MRFSTFVLLAFQSKLLVFCTPPRTPPRFTIVNLLPFGGGNDIGNQNIPQFPNGNFSDDEESDGENQAIPNFTDDNFFPDDENDNAIQNIPDFPPFGDEHDDENQDILDFPQLGGGNANGFQNFFQFLNANLPPVAGANANGNQNIPILPPFPNFPQFGGNANGGQVIQIDASDLDAKKFTIFKEMNILLDSEPSDQPRRLNKLILDIDTPYFLQNNLASSLPLHDEEGDAQVQNQSKKARTATSQQIFILDIPNDTLRTLLLCLDFEAIKTLVNSDAPGDNRFRKRFEEYVCHATLGKNIRLPANDLSKSVIFVTFALPILQRTVHADILSRGLTWTDLCWLTIVAAQYLVADNDPFLNVRAITGKRQLFAKALLENESTTFSTYGAYAIARARKIVLDSRPGAPNAAANDSVTCNLLKFLLRHDCREIAMFEMLLSMFDNLNNITIGSNKNILCWFIERDMFLPQMMERAELRNAYGRFSFNLERAHTYYDLLLATAIESRSFYVLKMLLQMDPDRFKSITLKDLETLRAAFVDHDGMATFSAKIAVFRQDPSPKNKLPDFQIREDDFMTILARFVTVPGQHVEIFYMLCRSGGYDLSKVGTYFFVTEKYDLLRQIVAEVPDKFDNCKPYETRAIRDRFKSIDPWIIIEKLHILPSFSLFDSFKLINEYGLCPWHRSFYIEWFMTDAANGDSCLLPEVDPWNNISYGKTLLQFAIHLQNHELVHFCLEKQVYSELSLNSASDYAKGCINTVILRTFGHI